MYTLDFLIHFFSFMCFIAPKLSKLSCPWLSFRRTCIEDLFYFRNDNEQQLGNKEKDQASPKKKVKAKKNKKKKMNKSLETAQEPLQENQDADEERFV